MKHDKNLWIIISTILSCAAILAYFIIADIPASSDYNLPAAGLLSSFGIAIPSLTKFLFAISICMLALASALVLDAYSSSVTAAILQFVTFIFISPLLMWLKIHPLSPMIVALIVMGIYFTLLGRKKLRSYTVHSKSGGILSNPQAGRSAIKARTKVATPIFTKELAMAAICFALASLMTPYAIYIGLSAVIFSLSYRGSFFKRFFRSLIFFIISISSTAALIIVNHSAKLSPGKESSIFDVSLPIAKGFKQYIYLGYDKIRSLAGINDILPMIIDYAILISLLIVGVFFVIRVIGGLAKSVERGIGSSYSEGNEFPYFGSYAFNLPSTLSIVALILLSLVFILPLMGGYISPAYGKEFNNGLFTMGLFLAIITKILILDAAISLFIRKSSHSKSSYSKKFSFLSIAFVFAVISVILLSVPGIVGGLYSWKII